MLDTPPEEETATACRMGSVKRLNELLDWGVSIHARHGGKGFLSIACEHGRLAVVKRLLEGGLEPTHRDLILAVLSGNTHVADRIADELHFSGVEVDYWHEGRPLLTRPGFLATSTPRMVKWLLRQGVDPRTRDRFGNDALAAAERDDAPDEIRALLTRGSARGAAS